MSTQTEQALALLFRRFKGETVPENELVKVMSLTLNWTKPSRASNLLDRGVNAGLLERTEEGYEARLDPNAVDVPFGFTPEDALFEPVDTPPAQGTASAEASDRAEAAAQSQASEEAVTPEEARAPEPEIPGGSPLEALVERIAEHVEGGRKRAVAAANAKQESLGGLVTLDVAALLVAKEMGIDVREDAEAILDDLRATA